MSENIIIAKNEADKLEEFQTLMKRTNDTLNERATHEPRLYKSLNGTALEGVVYETMKELCTSTTFKPSDIELKSAQSFPDIITKYFNSETEKKYYGVEVKTTKENKWTSTGSSIVESTRIADVSQILMLFGKLGNPIEFRCRPYQECLSGIAVTHSPRYLIDMSLQDNENIFAKMDTTYDMFRNSPNNIEQVRQYYMREGANNKKLQMPWWMNGTTNINLSFFGDLDTAFKFELISRALILFSETYNSDYRRTSLWLCSRYSILAPNIRDSFSAGGRCKSINGIKLKKPYPQIVKRILVHLPQIKLLLTNPNEDFKLEIKEFWQLAELPNNLFEHWINLVKESFKNSTQLKTIRIKQLIKSEATVTE